VKLKINSNPDPEFKRYIKEYFIMNQKLKEDLKGLNGRFYPVIRKYRENVLEEEYVPGDFSPFSFAGCTWECSILENSNSGEDYSFKFSLLEGDAESVGVGVVFDFSEWRNDNYIFLPAAVYSGNDFTVSDVKYPPLWYETSQFDLDMPVTTTDLPRISADSQKLEQTTGDTSVPSMGFYSTDLKKGFLLFTDQAATCVNNGLSIEMSDRDKCRFMVTAPGVREFRQDHCRKLPSEDRGISMSPGDYLVLNITVSVFDSLTLQGLFNRFCELRKSVVGVSEEVYELPFSAGWDILESKYNSDNWDEEFGYYKMAPNFHTTFETVDRPLCFLWQLGWVGGGIITLPMLSRGNELTRKRALRNLAMIFEKTAISSGFFYGLGDGENFYTDGFDSPHPHNMQLVRKNGDWLYFGVKQIDLLLKQKENVPQEWLELLHNLAGAFVRMWDEFGQFGQFINPLTGEILVGGSTSGGIIPAALLKAGELFSDQRCIEVAEASALKYYNEFLMTGITTGGPGEILSAPDSESAFALLESCVALAEKTGADFWIQAAKDLVRFSATWVVGYDYKFPENSPFGQNSIHSSGSVWANIQNKHSAPGICTFSGDSLFRYWRMSGDLFALELIKDTAHGIPQYLAREDRLLSPEMKHGWMCERVNLSDWEGAEGVGNSLFGSAIWPETAFMLTVLEIPGIYIQPDTGFIVIFDHIELVGKSKNQDGSLSVTLTNPTKFDASVMVMVESSGEQKRVMPLNAHLLWREIDIPASAQKTFTFKMN
jgi:hypothetical protein